MLLNWVVLWNELEMKNRSRRRDPLADPLDGPEWRGLQWLVPVIVQLASRNDVRRPNRTAEHVTHPSRNSGAAHGGGILR